MSPLFPLIQSDLDLNGPVLSFTTQPVGTSCSVASGIATFIGIATATFPDTQIGRDTNTGTVTYQWYKGSTAITDGTGVTGSATTTLTLSGLTNPDDDSSDFFVQVGYDPNDLTPNAINEPINSDSADLTVFPTISIDTQPVDTTVVEDIETSFSIAASTSDGSPGLEYQWILDGTDLVDGTSKTVIDIPKGSFSFASGDGICVRTSTAASAGNITAITDSTITDSNPGNVADGAGIYRVLSGKQDWIKIEFASTQTGVTEIKLKGGSYVYGTTYNLYINDELIFSDRLSVLLWSTDTISLSKSYDIDSIRIEGSDGYAIGNLRFNGTTVVGDIGSCLLPNDKEVSTTVTGSNTDTLTINAEATANGTIRCKCTASNVQESPVFSNTVSYVVVEPRSLLEIETYNYTDATATLSEFDLANGDLTIDYASFTGNAVCLYAGDKDIDIEMEMYGGKGPTITPGVGADGGDGGYSKIRFTMERNVEHVLTGLFSAVNAPFLYRKASLIACVGAGGAGRPAGGNSGGQGGGIGISGERGGSAQGTAAGGEAVQAGEGTLAGAFGGNFNGTELTGGIIPPDKQAAGGSGAVSGGNSIICTRGIYWREQGLAPCDDVGTVKFRTPNGTEISNTATIARGYKSGYNVIQTGGEGIGQQGPDPRAGDGGCGFTGGAGGDNRGGGGGSGYTDGSVTVVDTQLGGSDGDAKVIIRIADPNLIDPATTLETVTFTVGREAAFSNIITFAKESGNGPEKLIFGPNAGTVTVSLARGAVYNFESKSVNGDTNRGSIRLSNGVLQFEDAGDNDFNDLTVTPNSGQFVSATRYQFV